MFAYNLKNNFKDNMALQARYINLYLLGKFNPALKWAMLVYYTCGIIVLCLLAFIFFRKKILFNLSALKISSSQF